MTRKAEEYDERRLREMLKRAGVWGRAHASKERVIREYGFTEGEADAFVNDMREALREHIDDPLVDRLLNNEALCMWLPILFFGGLTVAQIIRWLLSGLREKERRERAEVLV